ncbi:ABC transporter permease [Streptomyces hebeiensis]
MSTDRTSPGHGGPAGPAAIGTDTPAGAAGPATGAGPRGDTRIHNIGYRGYDGARLGRAYARRSLYTQSLRGSYGLGRSGKSKVLPMILFAVMCLPAAIIVAVAVATDLKDLPLDYTRYAIFTQAVIGLYLAAQAPQSVSRDLRFKTVPLYFSRPIERVDYVLAKYGAMASALFLLTGVPLVILYVGSLLAEMDFAEQTKGFGQGLVSVALLSVLFGGIGLVLAALTPRRGFGVAGVIATLTISYGAVSTLQAIAWGSGSPAAVKWIGLFSPITLIDGVQTAFLGASSSFPGELGPSAGAGVVYLLVVLALVLGSYAVLMRRYRKVGL